MKNSEELEKKTNTNCVLVAGGKGVEIRMSPDYFRVVCVRNKGLFHLNFGVLLP